MNDISTSLAAHALLRHQIRFDVEEVWAVALNSQLKPLQTEMIFRGHAMGCVVHAREIFRFGILHNAVQMIVAHSHPSGDSLPSEEDLRLTERLFQAGRVLGIPLVDHLILSQEGYSSMAELGWFEKWKKKKSVRLG